MKIFANILIVVVSKRVSTKFIIKESLYRVIN